MSMVDVDGQGHMRSGSAATFAGLTVRALRHYQRCGLVHPIRDQSRCWRYPPVELARLVRIRALRELGLGLEQIRTLIERDDDGMVSALDELRSDLRSRAAALTHMADTVEQVLAGSSRAQLSTSWKAAVQAAGVQSRDASWSPFRGQERADLVDLVNSAPVVEVLARLGPRLRALRAAPPDSPEVSSLASELAATLPAVLLPTALTDGALLTILLGPRFSAAQLRCVLDAGQHAHAGRIGGPR